MALILTDVQACALAVAFVDRKGNPASVDGAPVWSVSDPTVLGIIASADGFSADIIAIGPLGNSQVSVTADADLGSGVENVIGVLDVTVVGSRAVAAVVSASAPTEVAP